MSCEKSLRTQGLTGADPGGTWTYDGYSDTQGGPYTVGAWNPVLTGDDPTVDFTGQTPGFYGFTYEGTDCNGDPTSVQLEVEVVPSADAGDDGATQVCDSQTVTITLFDELGGTPDSGGSWELSSGTLDPNSTFNQGAGTVDFVNHPPGVLVFTYTVSPPSPSGGGTLQNCPNCEDDTSTVTITINEDFNPGTPNNFAVCN